MRIELLFSEFYPGTFIVDIESESERDRCSSTIIKCIEKEKKLKRIIVYLVIRILIQIDVGSNQNMPD